MNAAKRHSRWPARAAAGRAADRQGSPNTARGMLIAPPRSLFEKLFYLVHPRLALGTMLGTASLGEAFEFLQQIFLLVR